MGSDGHDEPAEAVEFLSRSGTRVRLLEALAVDGRLSKDDLRDRVDASRTTVGRNLTALAERGWIRKENRTYEITRAGEWVVEDFTALVESVRDGDRFRPVFDCVDPDELGFDLREHEFSVTTADPGDPLKMVNRHVANLRGADELRALLPLAGANATDTVAERVVEAGLSVTLVVAPAVAEAFRTNPEYTDRVRDLRNADTVTISVYDGDVPYYVGLYRDSVEFGLDQDGRPKVLLETDAEAVYAWAEAEFSTRQAAATPFDEWEPS